MEQMRADTEDFDLRSRTNSSIRNGGESGDQSRVARFGSGSVSAARCSSKTGSSPTATAATTATTDCRTPARSPVPPPG